MHFLNLKVSFVIADEPLDVIHQKTKLNLSTSEVINQADAFRCIFHNGGVKRLTIEVLIKYRPLKK